MTKKLNKKRQREDLKEFLQQQMSEKKSKDKLEALKTEEEMQGMTRVL